MPGRLIDAHDLIESFLNTDADVCAEYYDYGCDWGFSLKSIINLIQNAPTVDAVPVVRCKDCKHLMFSDCYGECGACHLGIVRPDDFCSRGIRKDDHHVDDR